MIIACYSLKRYMEILQEWPNHDNLSVALQQELMDLLLKHLLACERAGVRATPKHHLMVHLTARTCEAQRTPINT